MATFYIICKNMKKYFILLLMLHVLILANAQKVEIDGIFYNLNTSSKTAEVTSNINKYFGKISIPSTVNYENITYSVTTIGPKAFYDCSNLVSVTIPNSVTSIGDVVFGSCTRLTTITIPNSVTDIGVDAFAGSGLNSIVIPNSVKTIRHGAFFCCSRLTSVTIGTGLTSIDELVFGLCRQLTSITIPNSVKTIGNNAFQECTSLTTITIPNSVTSIGKYAFHKCNVLKTVVIGSSVKYIYEKAFAECNKLNELQCLSANVPSTASSAFENSLLTNVTLYVPRKSLDNYRSTIPWSEFGKVMPLLNGIVFADETVEALCVAKWDTNQNGELSKDEAAAVINLGSVFKNKSISSFDELQYFIGLTSIDKYAFQGCSSLASLTLSDSIKTIDVCAFDGCSGLTSIMIPYNVTTIEDNAFRNCSVLTTVSIGNSVKNIGDNAFLNCNNLTSVHINDLSAWCGIQFGNYSNPLIYAHHLYLNGREVNDLAIPDDVEIIRANVFSGCTGLTSVTIGKNVTNIGSKAFYGCKNIEVLVSDLKTFFAINFEDGTANPINGRRLFVNGKLLEGTLNIDETYTNLSSYALYGYKHLFHLIISNPSAIVNPKLDLSQCDSLKNFIWISDDNLSNKVLLPRNVSIWKIPNTQSNTGKNLFSIASTQSTITYFMSNIFSGAESTVNERTFNMDNNKITITGLAPEKEYTMKMKGTIFDEEITFDYNYKTQNLELYLEMVNATNTTMTVKGYNIGDAELFNPTLKIYDVNSELDSIRICQGCDVVFTDLKPGSRYYVIYIVHSNDGRTFTRKNYYYTQSIDAKYDYIAGVTTCVATGTPLPIDAVVSRWGFRDDYDLSLIELQRTKKGLDPAMEYRWTFMIETDKGVTNNKTFTFRTKSLTMETQRAELVSDKKAMISAKTNCDDDSLRCGFEWRRYDAPNEMPSNIVNCPVYDGMISGTLNGLSTTTYYKFRPFYQSDSGRKYYGDWVAFITADAYVYFDPVVHTYDDVEVKENTASVKGYVLAGSDEIIEQGFEYWSSFSEHKFHQASGTLMRATLNNLDGQTDYYFRTYAKTSMKTIYGEEQTFQTLGSSSDGIREHLYLQEDSNIYDMLGRKVNNVIKGKMYISKGKKFIAK